MAFVTYILVVGYMLGMQDRFSPEVLGTTSGSALTMFILELVMIYLTTRIMSINTNLKMFDTMAFCMYKYVGMIFSLVVGMFFSSSGYYLALIYISLALALFLFRTLHLRVEPEVEFRFYNSPMTSSQSTNAMQMKNEIVCHSMISVRDCHRVSLICYCWV